MRKRTWTNRQDSNPSCTHQAGFPGAANGTERFALFEPANSACRAARSCRRPSLAPPLSARASASWAVPMRARSGRLRAHSRRPCRSARTESVVCDAGTQLRPANKAGAPPRPRRDTHTRLRPLARRSAHDVACQLAAITGRPRWRSAARRSRPARLPRSRRSARRASRAWSDDPAARRAAKGGTDSSSASPAARCCRRRLISVRKLAAGLGRLDAC